jgi:xanthine dehydrogenase molybdenum-binding subunit
MLYAKVLRSPYSHAIIKSIDKSKAEALPGVKAVLTYADVPDWRSAENKVVRVLDNRARYVGDAVALIAAKSEETAAEAADLIQVEYERLPAVYDMEEAILPGAPQLHIGVPGNIVEPGPRPWFGPKTLHGVFMGDVEQGLAEADVVVEGTASYENLPNALAIESPGVIASWDSDNHVTLWMYGQGGRADMLGVRGTLSKAIDIRKIGGPSGGGFGQRNMTVLLALQALALSKATRAPVRLILSKEEHFAAFNLRLQSKIRAQIGMKKDGSVTAVKGDWLVGTGAYSFTTQMQIAVGCGEAQLVVRCPNWDLKTKIISTNRTPSGVVRGFGGQELKCCLIPLLSLAMEKLDIDPVDFFIKNYVKPGDVYYWRNGERYVYRGITYTKAMEEGARAFGWKDKWKGWLKPTSVDGAKRRGVGVGAHGNADIGEDASEAYVRLDPGGTALIYAAATEHGTGQPSNLVKMVAEVLQLPLHSVSMTPPDSNVVPLDYSAVGSRGTYAIGGACISAAEDALQKLFALAAPALGADPRDLQTADGEIFSKHNPDKKIRWQAALGLDRTVLGYGRFEADYTLANCMMSFVEVEVDTDTGQVTLLRVVNATDVGQIIDPPGLENQLNGCLGTAGIDSALFEETLLDPGTGRMLNPNMIDYKWRTFADLPQIQNVVLESSAPSHRFHAIGVGEVATAPGPTAVLMAVCNAIGVRLFDYPLTPERVLKALGKAADKTAKGRSE